MVILLPFLLVLPPIGRAVAASRWSAISWIAGIGLGLSGTTTIYPLSHREEMLYWVPLYQLAIYTAALQLFRRSLHRFPRFAVWDLFTEGLFWDQLFLIGVLLVSIIPCTHFLEPYGAAAP
jgi:hypothetical protein